MSKTNRRKRCLQEELATTTRAFEAPFSLYTPDAWLHWMSPILTLPGKVPHRMASTVRR